MNGASHHGARLPAFASARQLRKPGSKKSIWVDSCRQDGDASRAGRSGRLGLRVVGRKGGGKEWGESSGRGWKRSRMRTSPPTSVLRQRGLPSVDKGQRYLLSHSPRPRHVSRHTVKRRRSIADEGQGHAREVFAGRLPVRAKSGRHEGSGVARTHTHTSTPRRRRPSLRCG